IHPLTWTRRRHADGAALALVAATLQVDAVAGGVLVAAAGGSPASPGNAAIGPAVAEHVVGGSGQVAGARRHGARRVGHVAQFLLRGGGLAGLLHVPPLRGVDVAERLLQVGAGPGRCLAGLDGGIGGRGGVRVVVQVFPGLGVRGGDGDAERAGECEGHGGPLHGGGVHGGSSWQPLPMSFSRQSQEAAHEGRRAFYTRPMTGFLLWCVLLVLCWPLALLALVLWPLVWLVSLPFRLVGITFGALFALLKELLYLPARVLGWRPAAPAT